MDFHVTECLLHKVSKGLDSSEDNLIQINLRLSCLHSQWVGLP